MRNSLSPDVVEFASLARFIKRNEQIPEGQELAGMGISSNWAWELSIYISAKVSMSIFTFALGGGASGERESFN